ncbi:hypothetical protein AGMMS49975_00390 [Clostridia bacterium]|nr:hypothetical protein AGMMS49975_00390 [Clostridia bacterium]
MKLAIMQPYFLPYIGYWQLIYAVDKFVVYDDVNYIKSGWINRNNILSNGKKQLFTVKLSGASSFKLINQITVIDDFAKFTRMLQQNYQKAPRFKEVMALVSEILDFNKDNLALFILNSIRIITEYLEIDTELLLSSDLEKDTFLKAQEKVIDICARLKATEYYNAIGGKELYSTKDFRDRGIDLKFLKTNFVPYSQFGKEFVAGLSILDVLMFNEIETIREMLGDYSFE